MYLYIYMYTVATLIILVFIEAKTTQDKHGERETTKLSIKTTSGASTTNH